MTRLLIAALFFFAVSPAVALADEPVRANMTVQTEPLRQEYLELAKDVVDDLSDEELKEGIARFKQQRDQIDKDKLRDRMATEIESRLVAEYEYFLGLIEEYPRGSEVALVAETMRSTLQEKIECVRKWKAGKVNFPQETVKSTDPSWLR